MAELTVQSNTDGSFAEYETFGEYEHLNAVGRDNGDVTGVTSVGLVEYADPFPRNEDGVVRHEDYEKLYMGLDERNVAEYDIGIPEGATISGTPEIGCGCRQVTTNLTGS